MSNYPEIKFYMIIKDFENMKVVGDGYSENFSYLLDIEENQYQVVQKKLKRYKLIDSNTEIVQVTYISQLKKSEFRNLLIKVDTNGFHNYNGEHFSFEKKGRNKLYLTNFLSKKPDIYISQTEKNILKNIENKSK